MNKIFVVIFGLIILSSFTSSLACVGLGGGGYTVLTSKEQPTYITYTVFNNDSKNFCDSGKYNLELSLENEELSKIFDYSISEEGFILNDGESKRVLITLIPLVSNGEFVLKVSALRSGLIANSTSTSVMPKTISSIKINISDEYNSKFKDLPQWYLLKQKQNKELIIKIICFCLLGVLIIIIGVFLFFKYFSKYKVNSKKNRQHFKYK
jgi:hypothetical protein